MLQLEMTFTDTVDDRSYVKGVGLLLLIFDLSQAESFEQAVRMFESMKNANKLFFLIGCKADLPRAVHADRIFDFCLHYKSKIVAYQEVSAKNDLNVREAFDNITNFVRGVFKVWKHQNPYYLRNMPAQFFEYHAFSKRRANLIVQLTFD